MPVKTMKLGPGELSIGGTTSPTVFSSQARSVKLVPSVDRDDDEYVLSGEQVEGDRTETWALEGTFVQDVGATDSTTEWLFDHRGERHPFTFVPNTATGVGFTGEIIVEAIEIGGDAMTKPTSDFEFALIGPPTKATQAG